MIDELIERVEKGEGADRELDIAIWRLFHDAPENKQPLPWMHCYTASLDAVLALIEENRSTIMDNSPADFLAGCIEEMMVRGWRPHEPSGPQICRAVLAAFLRAHKEQHDATR